jgi:hypothetical protein
MNAPVFLASFGRLFLQTPGTNGLGVRDRHVYKSCQYLRVMIQNL